MRYEIEIYIPDLGGFLVYVEYVGVIEGGEYSVEVSGWQAPEGEKFDYIENKTEHFMELFEEKALAAFSPIKYRMLLKNSEFKLKQDIGKGVYILGYKSLGDYVSTELKPEKEKRIWLDFAKLYKLSQKRDSGNITEDEWNDFLNSGAVKDVE